MPDKRRGRTVPHKQKWAEEWCDRLRKMHRLGISYRQIAEMSGVSLTNVKQLAAGERSVVRDSTAAKLKSAAPRFELAVRLRAETIEFQGGAL